MRHAGWVVQCYVPACIGSITLASLGAVTVGNSDAGRMQAGEV